MSSKQRNADFGALLSGAEADDTIVDRGVEVLSLTTSNVDGDEVNSKVVPYLPGFHLPQEADVWPATSEANFLRTTYALKIST